LLLRFKTSDDPTMSDHRIMIGRSLCRNFAHHCRLAFFCWLTGRLCRRGATEVIGGIL
jgi:hypothetical protein